MSYINDDLKELFQKAASDYPLKTDNSNWEGMVAKLNAAPGKTAAKGKYLLKYAVLALLFLGSSAIIYTLKFDKAKTVTDKIQQKKIQRVSKEIPNKTPELPKKNDLLSLNNRINQDHTSSEAVKSQIKSDAPSNFYHNNVSTFTPQPTIANNENVTINKFFESEEVIIVPSRINENNQLVQIIQEGKISNDIADKQIIKKPIATHNTNSTKQLVKFKPVPFKFYGTLYASPEFSMVKFQKIDKPGYKIGVALGYRVNKRFDIEIGVQREKINFYSDGKYFDKEALKIKPGATLESVDGHSKITTVPVTVKYNFTSKNNGHFYAAAGVNGVQITHTENYDYVISKNSGERDRSKKYSSVTGAKYFTGITASAGYEMKVCNWFNIKAEPYYQVPIQNFGVGNLPVTSFGMNVGIVKGLK